jgi:hypothetical protein
VRRGDDRGHPPARRDQRLRLAQVTDDDLDLGRKFRSDRATARQDAHRDPRPGEESDDLPPEATGAAAHQDHATTPTVPVVT